MTPTLLSTPKQKAEEALLKELKELLSDTEAGEVESLCFVAWKRNGDVKTYSHVEEITRKVGALTRMIHDLLNTR